MSYMYLFALLALCALSSAQFNYNNNLGGTTPATSFTLAGIAEFQSPNFYLTKESNGDPGSAAFQTKQLVATSFRIEFSYSVGIVDSPGDGLAVVIQNSGQNALTGGGGTLSYAYANNIAIEVDTHQNGYDPNNNHVSVHYAGSPTAINSPDETKSIALGTPKIDLSPTGEGAGAVTIRVEYDHLAGIWFTYYLDNSNQPVPIARSGIKYFIDSMLNLDAGKAWVGIQACGGVETMDVYVNRFMFNPQTIATPLTVICPHDLVVEAEADTCMYSGTTGTAMVINNYSRRSNIVKWNRGPYSVGTHKIKYYATDKENSDLYGICVQTVVVNPPAGNSCVQPQ